jgi:hypothetical protein
MHAFCYEVIELIELNSLDPCELQTLVAAGRLTDQSQRPVLQQRGLYLSSASYQTLPESCRG